MVTWNMTPEQLALSVRSQLEEYYPHIDLERLYPIHNYSTDVKDDTDDDIVTVTVSFRYRNKEKA